MKHIFLFLPLLLALSCSKPKITSDMKLDNTCWENRNEEKEVINEIGEIMIINDVFLIKVTDSKQYVVCDVPYDFQSPGTKVIFSGMELNIRPNERLMGRPLKLTALRANNR